MGMTAEPSSCTRLDFFAVEALAGLSRSGPGSGVSTSRLRATRRRDDGRRRSRLIHGTREDAERALEEYGPALSSGTLESARADESRAGSVERMPDAAGPDANGARRDSSPRSEKAPRRSPKTGRSARKSDRLRRPQGTGGVLPVRDGVWRLSTETPRNPETGQRRRATRVVYGTREDAELALANLRVAASRQRQPVRRADRRSMRAVFDLYLRDAKDGRIELAVKTQVTSKSAANAMCKQRLSDGRLFGEARPDRLMWADIEDLYATMRRSGLGVDWIRRCATVLNRSLEYAKKRDVIDSNPCQEATRPRTTRSKPYSPPPAVVDALDRDVAEEERADRRSRRGRRGRRALRHRRDRRRDRSSQRRAACSARRGCRLEGAKRCTSRLPSPTAARVSVSCASRPRSRTGATFRLSTR